MRSLILICLLAASGNSFACAGFTLDHSFEKQTLENEILRHLGLSRDDASRIVLDDYTGSDRVYVCASNYLVSAVALVRYRKEGSRQAKLIVTKYGDFSNSNGDRYFVHEIE